MILIMGRSLEKLSLKKKIQKFIIVIGLIYISLFFLLYLLVIRPKVNQEIEETNYEALKTVENTIVSELNKVDILGRQIMSDPKILSYMKGSTELSDREIIADLYSIITPYDHIASIFIIRNDYTFLSIANTMIQVNEQMLKNEQWNQRIDDKKGSLILMLNGGQVFEPLKKEKVISLARQFNDNNTQRSVGKLVINLSGRSFADFLPNMDNLEITMNTFGNNEAEPIITNETSEQVQTIQRKKYELMMKEYPLNIMLYDLGGTGFSSFKVLIYIVTFFFLVTVCLLWLVLSFVQRSLIFPLSNLVDSMKEAGKGQFKKLELSLDVQELLHVKNTFNQMIVEIHTLVKEIEENQKKIKNTEFEAIQEQIKPHFLYNTLDTIALLALENTREETYLAIEALGQFYRSFLNNGNSEISLREELAIVKSYVSLQNRRYGDIVKVTYTIDDELLDRMLPKIILQPLVENAIYHGIRPKGEPGLIEIKAYSEQGQLFLCVFDNGIGIGPKALSQTLHTRKGFGLSRTIERLCLVYGRKMEELCQIETKAEEYFRITLRLPLEGDGNDLSDNDCR